MFEIHRCGARPGKTWCSKKRRKGKPSFHKIKNFEKFYTQIKEDILADTFPHFRAETFAKKYQCKVHFVTQAFARLNREGILTQATNSIVDDGCWTASVYSKVIPKVEEPEEDENGYYMNGPNEAFWTKNVNGYADDEGFYTVEERRPGNKKRLTFFIKNSQDQWEEIW